MFRCILVGLRFLAFAIFAASVACSPAAAQTVVDGDTITLAGVTWRLFGIHAPEMHQRCGDWPAGRTASLHLQELMKSRSVFCKSVGVDRDGRTVGLCRANGVDLGRAMVRDGMAWAYFQNSRAYIGDEAVARAAKLGVHGHDCEPPWEWRAGNLPELFWQLNPVEAADESQGSHR